MGERNTIKRVGRIAGVSVLVGPSARSPFGVSTEWREYIPMVLVILTLFITGWLWWRIKRPVQQVASDRDLQERSGNSRDQ